MTTQGVTYSFCFYPLTQTYNHGEDSKKEPSVYVRLTALVELSSKNLSTIIQKLGNYMALVSLKQLSQDNESLTQEEMRECDEMQTHLALQALPSLGIPSYDMSGLDIPPGDIAAMRRILHCVRSAIQKA